MAADRTYVQGTVYREVGGAREVVSSGASLDVESGGEIDIESGGVLKIAGSDRTAALATAPAAIAAGKKIAHGTVTLDGSNPTPVATGLATIESATVSLKTATAPGDDPSWLTCDFSGSDGTLNVYAWKNTGGTDPTLVASTNASAVVTWIAVGT